MKKRDSYRLPEEKVAYIREHFHDTADQDIADALGISICTVKKYRTILGLRKDPEYISKVNRERAIQCGNGERINTPEAYAKRIQTKNEQYRRDKLMVKWGLKPKYNRHYRTEPRARLLQRNRLKRLGYIVDEQNLVAYWTEDTKRAVRIERIPRGTKKGSIKAYYSFAEWIG